MTGAGGIEPNTKLEERAHAKERERERERERDREREKYIHFVS